MSAGNISAPLPPSVITEFFGWWTAELRGLFAIFSRARPQTSNIPPVDLAISRSGILAGEGKAAFASDQALDAVQALRLPRRMRGRGLHLSLEADRFVVRRLATGRVPLARAHRMAELDVSANTPFALDDIYILFAYDGASREGTDYILVRRDIIDPILAAIKAGRYRLGFVTLGQGGVLRPVHPSAVEGFNSGSGSLLPLLRKRFFFVCCCLALGALFWNLLFSLDRATAEVNARIEAVEPAAQKARQAFKKQSEYLSRLQALYQEREDYTPAAKILEELTRLIPDDTFLTDFTLRNRKIQVSGFSASAASLISIIDSSSLFKNPRFTTAVVKVPDRKGEQFSMEIELDHAG